MTWYDLVLEGYHAPLTAEQIAELFRAGRLRRTDGCREVDQRQWRTIDELFPLLKYDSSGRVSETSPNQIRRINSAAERSDEPGDVDRPMSSALKAGWICFGIGLAISWFFPFGQLFFSVALVTAVVAMCTHQVNRGLVLLLSAFVGMALCAAIFFLLVVGTIGMAVAPVARKANADLKRMQATQAQTLQQMNRATAQLQPNLTTVNTPRVPRSFANAPSSPLVANTPFDRQQQHELAMAQQREADARKAADQRQRNQSVREAERQRDVTNAKEERLQQIQNSIDWNDRMIRQVNDYNGNPKVFQDQRDSLLQQKAKLQGY